MEKTFSRAIDKILGERIMHKQDTHHLMLSLLMVSGSHGFFKVNLNDDVNRVDIDGSNDAGKSNVTIESIIQLAIFKLKWPISNANEPGTS